MVSCCLSARQHIGIRGWRRIAWCRTISRFLKSTLLSQAVYDIKFPNSSSAALRYHYPQNQYVSITHSLRHDSLELERSPFLEHFKHFPKDVAHRELPIMPCSCSMGTSIFKNHGMAWAWLYQCIGAAWIELGVWWAVEMSSNSQLHEIWENWAGYIYYFAKPAPAIIHISPADPCTSIRK